MFCKNIWLKYKNNIIWKIKFKNLNKNSKLFFFLDWKMRYIYDVLLSRHIGKIRLFYLQVFFLIRESHPMFIDILSIPLLLTFSITQKFIYVRLSIQFIHVYKRIVYIFIIKTNHFWNCEWFRMLWKKIKLFKILARSIKSKEKYNKSIYLYILSRVI